MESFVDTTCQLGEFFAYGTALTEPILINSRATLLAYIPIDAAARSPYDTLYKDVVVTIIMTKNCGYESIRKWSTQHHMGPNGQAYPTSFNDLVEMMNSGNFEPDPFKPKSKRSNRNKNRNKKNEEKDEETIGAIVEPSPTTPTTDKPDPVENVPDSDNDEPIDDDLEASSQRDDSSDEDDIDTDMQRVFALINSGFDEDASKFDPEAEEERYYADCNEALNDNKIVGCVALEPTYEEDNYIRVNHTDSMFDDIQKGWPDGGLMPHEKMELEGV